MASLGAGAAEVLVMVSAARNSVLSAKCIANGGNLLLSS